MKGTGSARTTRQPMRAIQQRRRFTDPICKRCGPGPVKYQYRLNGRNKRKVFCDCANCLQEIKHFSKHKVPARIRLSLEPHKTDYEMRYSGRPSEFEIQAYLYCELRRFGYDARGEVSTKDGDCRFDVVVFVGRKPRRIIEVKKSRKQYRSKQIEYYRSYGVKVVSVCGMEQAKELIRKAGAARKGPPLPMLVWL
jgi:hypothetical protein